MDTNENHHQTPPLHGGAAAGMPIDEAFINGLYDGQLTFNSLLTSNSAHDDHHQYLFFNPSTDFASSFATSFTHPKPEPFQFVDYNDVVVPASPLPYDLLVPFPSQNDAAMYYPDDVALLHHGISPFQLGSLKTSSLTEPASKRFVQYSYTTGPAAPANSTPHQTVPFQLRSESSSKTGSLHEPSSNRSCNQFVPYSPTLRPAAPPSSAPSFQVRTGRSKTGSIANEPEPNRKLKRSGQEITGPAASARRRHHSQRISDRMWSLQKLLPLEKRVTSASMLEEACKYVKFLKAQVSVLRSMPCYPVPQPPVQLRGENIENGTIELLGRLNRQQLLQVMANSPAAQSVLYKNGCCVYSAEQVNALFGVCPTDGWC